MSAVIEGDLIAAPPSSASRSVADIVSPALTLRGTVSAALDAGKFRAPSKAFNIPDTGGRRIIADNSHSGN